MKIITTILLSAVLSCNRPESAMKRTVTDYIRARVTDPKSLEFHNWKIAKEGNHVYIVLVDFGHSNGEVKRNTKKFKIIGESIYEQPTTIEDIDFYK